MSIQPSVLELRSIENELKQLNIKAKKLKENKKALQLVITNYIKANNLPGVKFQGFEIRVEQKDKHGSKAAKKRDADAIGVLKEFGINDKDAEDLFKKLMYARKGELESVDLLKMKKPSKKKKKPKK